MEYKWNNSMAIQCQDCNLLGVCHNANIIGNICMDWEPLPEDDTNGYFDGELEDRDG